MALHPSAEMMIQVLTDSGLTFGARRHARDAAGRDDRGHDESAVPEASRARRGRPHDPRAGRRDPRARVPPERRDRAPVAAVVPRWRLGHRQPRHARPTRAVARRRGRRGRGVGRLPTRAGGEVPRPRPTTASPRTSGRSRTPTRSAPTRHASRSAATARAEISRRSLRSTRANAGSRSRSCSCSCIPSPTTSSTARRWSTTPRATSSKPKACAGSGITTRVRRPTSTTRASRRCARPTCPGSRRAVVVTAEYDPLRDQGEAYGAQPARRGRADRGRARRRSDPRLLRHARVHAARPGSLGRLGRRVAARTLGTA